MFMYIEARMEKNDKLNMSKVMYMFIKRDTWHKLFSKDTRYSDKSLAGILRCLWGIYNVFYLVAYLFSTLGFLGLAIFINALFTPCSVPVND